jgi:hypothetical protein
MNDTHLTAIQNEVVRLAVAEGHDADIPTNQGTVSRPDHSGTLTSNSPLNSPYSFAEKDVEKDGSSPFSKASSLQSTQPIEDDEAEGPASNVVWWNGENDQDNPMNWPSSRRWTAVSIVSCITFLTPLGSSIFAPGVNLVMEEFHSDSKLLSGFVVSVYVLGFAFGPLGMY